MSKNGQKITGYTFSIMFLLRLHLRTSKFKRILHPSRENFYLFMGTILTFLDPDCEFGFGSKQGLPYSGFWTGTKGKVLLYLWSDVVGRSAKGFGSHVPYDFLLAHPKVSNFYVAVLKEKFTS
jgi:hypothetical protein